MNSLGIRRVSTIGRMREYSAVVRVPLQKKSSRLSTDFGCVVGTPCPALLGHRSRSTPGLARDYLRKIRRCRHPETNEMPDRYIRSIRYDGPW